MSAVRRRHAEPGRGGARPEQGLGQAPDTSQAPTRLVSCCRLLRQRGLANRPSRSHTSHRPTRSRRDHRRRHLGRSARRRAMTCSPQRIAPACSLEATTSYSGPYSGPARGRGIAVVRCGDVAGDRPAARLRTGGRTYAAASTFTVRREWPRDCPGSPARMGRVRRARPRPGSCSIVNCCPPRRVTTASSTVTERTAAATSSRGFAFFGSNVENRRRLPATSATWMDVHNGTADDRQVHR